MSVPGPHIALIERGGEMRAMIWPADQPLDRNQAAWLWPHWDGEWHLKAFVPVAFIPDEPSNPKNWPAGEPDEAEIMAKINLSLERLVVIIRRGDLESLDKILTFAEAMAELFSEDFADDLFNLRNGMVPFKDGEAKALGLYDPSDDDEEGEAQS